MKTQVRYWPIQSWSVRRQERGSLAGVSASIGRPTLETRKSTDLTLDNWVDRGVCRDYADMEIPQLPRYCLTGPQIYTSNILALIVPLMQ